MNQLNNRGFTILELAVVTAVTGLLIIIIMNFMSGSMASIVIESARADLLSEAQLGLDAIDHDIRLSASAELNNRWPDDNAPDAPTNPLSWESNSHTLVLASAASDPSHNILFQDELNYITYKNNLIFFVSNGTLYKRTLAADIPNNRAQTSCPKNLANNDCLEDRPLINNVKQFDIRYVSGDDIDVDPANARSIEISIQLEAKRYGKMLNANYLTRMVFRNE